MGEFEKNIQDIFEDAEFQPSDQVWTGIEGKLKASKKKGLIFYWQNYGIAAAVILAIGFGFLFYDQLTQTGDSTPTEEVSEKEVKPQSDNKSTDEKEIKPSEEQAPPLIETKIPNQTLAKVTTDKKPDTTNGLVAETGESEPSVSNLSTTKEDFPTGIKDFDRGNEISLLELMERRSVAYQLEWRNKYLVPAPDFGNDTLPYFEEKTKDITLSALLANGSFNPEAGSGSFSEDALNSFVDNQALDDVAETVSNSENLQENSFSFGGGISLDLGRRWGFRTGLQFAQYKFSNRSNAYAEEGGKQLPIYVPAGFDEQSVFFVGNYNITSTLSTISIPVSFSYNLMKVDRFKLALSAGVGVDYFVAYKIKGDLNFLETRKVNFSENQVFNRLNLTALTGLEFGYKLNDRFGLGAEAFFRKYLTQSNLSNESGTSPAFYGLGLSLNYFLKP